MPKSPKINEQALGAELLNVLRERGLGSMSKTELDALLLHLIEAHSNGVMSNSEMALYFRAPVARIKRLRHEAILRFGGSDLNALLQRRLQALMRSANFEFPTVKTSGGKASGTRIVVVVEDEFTRSQLLGHLKKVGSHADWSFNAELLKVDPQALLRVMIGLLPEEDIEQLASGLNLTAGAKLEGQLVEAINDFATKARDWGLTRLADAAMTWAKNAATDSRVTGLVLQVIGMN